MEMQRLPTAEKSVLLAVVFCCLWTLSVPADARAQQFSTAKCTVQSVTKGNQTVWQIRGEATVTGLIAKPNTTSCNITITFEKKPKGAANWSDIMVVKQTVAANNGTANIDTGFQPFTPAPASGDQYRILVSGSWMNPGPPPTQGNLTAIGSLPITPVP